MRSAKGWIERGDCRIRYEEAGEGPALVFAHGLGGSYLSWWQQLAHFARAHRCVAFSHRGFAPSTAPAEGVDPGRYADDLAALADRLGLERLAIVAQSMGGWTALEFALRFPGRVSALVLCSTSGTIDTAAIAPELAAPLADWTRTAAAERARCEREGIHVAAGARMASEQPALHLLYRQIDDTSAGLDKGTLRQRLFAGRTRRGEEAKAIDAPVLVLGGEEDVVFPALVVAGLARCFRRGRGQVFPATGHSPYFERPQAFNDAVERFLLTGSERKP